MGSDAITGSLTRAAGENVVGSPYAIEKGSLTAGSNYNLTFVGANFTINKKSASVTPTAANKTGEIDPPSLTGTLSGFLTADNVTATYTRVPGETVGAAHIQSALLWLPSKCSETTMSLIRPRSSPSPRTRLPSLW